MKNVHRDKLGKYNFGNMELICKCEHKLSVHAGENETKERPCFNEDKNIDGATGIKCSCKNFKKK